jgi:hypothetical protein
LPVASKLSAEILDSLIEKGHGPPAFKQGLAREPVDRFQSVTPLGVAAVDRKQPAVTAASGDARAIPAA